MSTWLLPMYGFVFGAWMFLVRREGGVGVGVRYLYISTFATQLLLGPLFYWASDYPEDVDPAVILSLVGLAAFLVGGYMLAPLLLGIRPERLEAGWRQFIEQLDVDLHQRIAFWTSIVGIGVDRLGMFLGKIPTIRAITSQAGLLSYTGGYLLVLNGIWTKRPRMIVAGMVVFLLVGAYATFESGFAGVGLPGLFVLLSLVSLSRSASLRSWIQVAALLAVGLVAYNVWMAGRDALREQIEGQGSIGDRAAAFVEAATQTDPFDVFSWQQADRIHTRLDQSWLFTLGIEHTPLQEPFADGETLWEAVLALIPRAVWPDKPIVAGGTEFISRFTGIKYLPSVDVSVGAHPIFEFYVNFGVPGVIAGLFLFGLLCGVLDYKFLLRGSSSYMMQLVVMALNWAIYTTSRLTELAMSAGATLAGAWLLGLAVRDLQRRGYRFAGSPSRAPNPRFGKGMEQSQ